jgi:hypothetical protein
MDARDKPGHDDGAPRLDYSSAPSQIIGSFAKTAARGPPLPVAFWNWIKS